MLSHDNFVTSPFTVQHLYVDLKLSITSMQQWEQRITSAMIAMSDENWYDAALSRMSWRETYSAGLDADEQQARPIPQEQVQCLDCTLSFWREGDMARHNA